MQFLKRFTAKEVPIEHFFALNLSEETVRAAVWKVTEGQARIISLGQSVSWNGRDKEDLLKAADQTISQAGENIRPEPEQVIFGLPDSWTEKDAVNQEKKAYLKHLCEQLALKPMGFVATDTAIIAYLKIEEGTPLSAILVQLNTGEINLSLVKMGKVIGSQLVGRSGDLGADVEEGLSRFNREETLPARIILYNGGGDFEEDRQQLLSYDWEEKLPFIHFPKVESLDSEIAVRAVALAGGSEAAESLGIQIRQDVSPAKPTAAAMGFKANEDVAKAGVGPPPSAEPEFEPGPPPKTARKLPVISFHFDWVRKKIAAVLAGFPRGYWLLAAGIGLAVLIIGLFLLYWYLPRAEVIIYLDPQVIEQELEIKLDSEAVEASAESGPVLPVELVTKTVSGSLSAPVTGTATVGDLAKGKVTIFNKTDAVKTFVAGTVLLGPDNLAFSLDEDITVASSSAEEDSEERTIITPGKAEAGLTAANIGPESNLAVDTRLSFKQFSEDDYYAKSNGLSGGTTREIKAVAEADKKRLEAALLADLTEQAWSGLVENLADGRELIGSSIEPELTSKEFSHAVGAEAGELSLSGELVYEGISYRRSELEGLLLQAIKTEIPENYLVSDFNRLEPGRVEDLQLPVSYEVKLLPRLDLAELKDKLHGRYPETAEAYLVTLPRFVGADIKITPPLPRVLKTLPRLIKNISVEVKPAQ